MPVKARLVTPAEARLLLTVSRYHYITLEQLTRLYYRSGSQKYVNARLKQLVDDKYLARVARSSVTFPHVYLLGIRGVRFLRENELFSAALHPSEKKTLSLYFLQHHLAINDVMIAVEQLPCQSPAITLHCVAQDLDLAGRKLKACPDLWVQLTVSGEYATWWLEIDRGTLVEEERFKDKIKRIVYAVDTQAAVLLGAQPTAILFVTTAGEGRLKTIFRWAQLALRDIQNRGTTFRFTHLPPGEVSLTTAFLEPIWYQPFEQGVKPLLGL